MKKTGQNAPEHGSTLRQPSMVACLPVTLLALGLASPVQEVHGQVGDLGCQVAEQMPLDDRASPLDSASVEVSGETIKVCYGAPSARGRTMIGGEDVPYGDLWRTGANEPTMIHLSGRMEVGGLGLSAGSYSLYTIPDGEEWQVFISRSVDHWGNQIDPDVRAAEVGEFTVPREEPLEHVETMRFRFEEAMGDAADLILEWENYRITIPVELVG